MELYIDVLKTIIKDYYNWMLGHVLWQTPLPLGVSIP